MLSGLLREPRSELDGPRSPDQHHGASADIVHHQSARQKMAQIRLQGEAPAGAGGPQGRRGPGDGGPVSELCGILDCARAEELNQPSITSAGCWSDIQITNHPLAMVNRGLISTNRQ